MTPYQPYAPPGVGPAPMPYRSDVAGSPSAPVSELAVEMLRQTRPWVMFMGVLCFIGSAFMLLAGVGMAIAGAVAAGASKNPFAAMIGFVYIPLAFLYIYPGFKLVKYASAIGRLVEARASADLEEALLQQKSFWKFSGISAIVMFVLYFVFFIVMIAVGVSGVMKGFGT
jgi:hypothetical protein